MVAQSLRWLHLLEQCLLWHGRGDRDWGASRFCERDILASPQLRVVWPRERRRTGPAVVTG